MSDMRLALGCHARPHGLLFRRQAWNSRYGHVKRSVTTQLPGGPVVTNRSPIHHTKRTHQPTSPPARRHTSPPAARPADPQPAQRPSRLDPKATRAHPFDCRRHPATSARLFSARREALTVTMWEKYSQNLTPSTLSASSEKCSPGVRPVRPTAESWRSSRGNRERGSDRLAHP